MTIRATRALQAETPYRTQASSYYEGLASRLEAQAVANVPRSRSAWGAEQNRLGSWNTGVGALRAPGIGNAITNGVARPAFVFDPEDPDLERKTR